MKPKTLKAIRLVIHAAGTESQDSVSSTVEQEAACCLGGIVCAILKCVDAAIMWCLLLKLDKLHSLHVVTWQCVSACGYMLKPG